MSDLVLIVEDEQKLAELLADYFIAAQYQCHCLYSGGKVVDWVKHNHPDIILLDIMLPEKDGMQLCREIRQLSQVPIIMVTAKVEEVDKLLGLELGADDYICKPFSPREVVARVKAVLRRTQHGGQNQPVASTGIFLDKARNEVSYQGNTLALTAVEFNLLAPLVSEPGRIYSRAQLMDTMYCDSRVVSDRTIDSHIKKLRKKIAQICPEQELIQSVYGLGYRLILD
ncbi:response regulator [Litorilituus sediminis]|uniref:Response regulator n=1 Tax=Litorilituus sediminis TaxID=718192 RepID=A0A4P6P8D4_9GAMM|nr:response regulator [Litorilituus sediminis]QBG35707.1 response regulator [Litorilituus sediminis]